MSGSGHLLGPPGAPPAGGVDGTSVLVPGLDGELQQALVEYRLRSERAANRMEPIQRYCMNQLGRRGIADARSEVAVRVAYKHKKWDVARLDGHRPQIAITCRSIVSNHGGTVPNRIDDLLGEGVALHRAFPSAVLGYLVIMSRRDESRRAPSRTQDWFAALVASVTRAGGRGSPQDLPERFEAVACLEVDFDVEPHALSRCFVYPAERNNQDYNEFFDVLAFEYRERFS